MKRDPMETAAALLASSPIFQGAIPQELQAFLLRGGVPLHAFQRGETLCLPGLTTIASVCSLRAAHR